MSQNGDIEEKIILATLRVINREGIERATVRRICEEADVNVAAINYYFRSKKHLIEQSFHRSLSNAFNFMDFSASEDAGPQARLIHLLCSVVSMAIEFSGLARAHFTEPLLRQDYSGYSMQRLSTFIDEMVDDLYLRYEHPPARRDLRIAVTQAVSATIVIAAVLPDLPGNFSAVDLGSAADREEWVTRIVEGLLPKT